MSSEEKDPRPVIVRVEAGCAPEGCTLAEWLQWRRAEDARMRRELAEQLEAWAALRGGATQH